MKKIEEIILESSVEPKAKLFQPAKKAFEAPETGITIVKPAEYKVIKDCAETTLLFLPIEIFLKFKTPIQSLKGKFTRESVQDLYNRALTDYIAKILFELILETCPKAPQQLIKSNLSLDTMDSDDPYGSYGDPTPTVIDTTRSSVDTILLAYA